MVLPEAEAVPVAGQAVSIMVEPAATAAIGIIPHSHRVLGLATITNCRKAMLVGTAKSGSSGDAGLEVNLAGKSEQGEML